MQFQNINDNDWMAVKNTPSNSGSAPKPDHGIQLARVRRICTSIPGMIEKMSHGEPTFFTPKRVFAMFANNHHNDGRLAVWLPAAPGTQEAAIDESPDIYFRPPYVGPSGWIGVDLAKVDDQLLECLIREAFQLVSKKKPGNSPLTQAPTRRRPPPQVQQLDRQNKKP